MKKKGVRCTLAGGGDCCIATLACLALLPRTLLNLTSPPGWLFLTNHLWSDEPIPWSSYQAWSPSPESSYRPLSLSPIVQPMSPLQWQDGSWSHEKSCTAVGCPPWGCNVLKSLTAVCKVNLSVSISVVTTSESCIATWLHFEFTIFRWLIPIRQACSPLIQLFFGFASECFWYRSNKYKKRYQRDGNWLSRLGLLVWCSSTRATWIKLSQPDIFHLRIFRMVGLRRSELFLVSINIGDICKKSH